MAIVRYIWTTLAIFSVWFSVAAEAIATESALNFVKREVGEKLYQPQEYLLFDNGESGTVASLTAIAPAMVSPDGSAPLQRLNLYVYLSRKGEKWYILGSTSSMTDGLRSHAAEIRSTTAAEMAGSWSVTEEKAEWIRSHVLLAAGLDDEIISYFNAKRAIFEAIRTKIGSEPADQYGTIESAPPFDDLFKEGFIEYGERKVANASMPTEPICTGGNCFTLVITFSPPRYRVGYFFMDDPARLPPMTEDGYAIVRSLGDGWYFFRQK